MDIKLPSGITISGIPEGLTDEEIRSGAISQGLATEQDFSTPTETEFGLPIANPFITAPQEAPKLEVPIQIQQSIDAQSKTDLTDIEWAKGSMAIHYSQVDGSDYSDEDQLKQRMFADFGTDDFEAGYGMLQDINTPNKFTLPKQFEGYEDYEAPDVPDLQKASFGDILKSTGASAYKAVGDFAIASAMNISDRPAMSLFTKPTPEQMGEGIKTLQETVKEFTPDSWIESKEILQAEVARGTDDEMDVEGALQFLKHGVMMLSENAPNLVLSAKAPIAGITSMFATEKMSMYDQLIAAGIDHDIADQASTGYAVPASFVEHIGNIVGLKAAGFKTKGGIASDVIDKVINAVDDPILQRIGGAAGNVSEELTQGGIDSIVFNLASQAQLKRDPEYNISEKRGFFDGAKDTARSSLAMSTVLDAMGLGKMGVKSIKDVKKVREKHNEIMAAIAVSPEENRRLGAELSKAQTPEEYRNWYDSVIDAAELEASPDPVEANQPLNIPGLEEIESISTDIDTETTSVESGNNELLNTMAENNLIDPSINTPNEKGYSTTDLLKAFFASHDTYDEAGQVKLDDLNVAKQSEDWVLNGDESVSDVIDMIADFEASWDGDMTGVVDHGNVDGSAGLQILADQYLKGEANAEVASLLEGNETAQHILSSAATLQEKRNRLIRRINEKVDEGGMERLLVDTLGVSVETANKMISDFKNIKDFENYKKWAKEAGFLADVDAGRLDGIGFDELDATDKTIEEGYKSLSTAFTPGQFDAVGNTHQDLIDMLDAIDPEAAGLLVRAAKGDKEAQTEWNNIALTREIMQKKETGETLTEDEQKLYTETKAKAYEATLNSDKDLREVDLAARKKDPATDLDKNKGLGFHNRLISLTNPMDVIAKLSPRFANRLARFEVERKTFYNEFFEGTEDGDTSIRNMDRVALKRKLLAFKRLEVLTNAIRPAKKNIYDVQYAKQQRLEFFKSGNFDAYGTHLINNATTALRLVKSKDLKKKLTEELNQLAPNSDFDVDSAKWQKEALGTFKTLGKLYSDSFGKETYDKKIEELEAKYRKKVSDLEGGKIDIEIKSEERLAERLAKLEANHEAKLASLKTEKAKNNAIAKYNEAIEIITQRSEDKRDQSIESLDDSITVLSKKHDANIAAADKALKESSKFKPMLKPGNQIDLRDTLFAKDPDAIRVALGNADMPKNWQEIITEDTVDLFMGVSETIDSTLKSLAEKKARKNLFPNKKENQSEYENDFTGPIQEPITVADVFASMEEDELNNLSTKQKKWISSTVSNVMNKDVMTVGFAKLWKTLVLPLISMPQTAIKQAGDISKIYYRVSKIAGASKAIGITANAVKNAMISPEAGELGQWSDLLNGSLGLSSFGADIVDIDLPNEEASTRLGEFTKTMIEEGQYAKLEHGKFSWDWHLGNEAEGAIPHFWKKGSLILLRTMDVKMKTAYLESSIEALRSVDEGTRVERLTNILRGDSVMAAQVSDSLMNRNLDENTKTALYNMMNILHPLTGFDRAPLFRVAPFLGIFKSFSQKQTAIFHKMLSEPMTEFSNYRAQFVKYDQIQADSKVELNKTKAKLKGASEEQTELLNDIISQKQAAYSKAKKQKTYAWKQAAGKLMEVKSGFINYMAFFALSDALFSVTLQALRRLVRGEEEPDDEDKFLYKLGTTILNDMIDTAIPIISASVMFDKFGWGNPIEKIVKEVLSVPIPLSGTIDAVYKSVKNEDPTEMLNMVKDIPMFGTWTYNFIEAIKNAD